MIVEILVLAMKKKILQKMLLIICESCLYSKNEFLAEASVSIRDQNFQSRDSGPIPGLDNQSREIPGLQLGN